jgi:hypothetical protein
MYLKPDLIRTIAEDQSAAAAALRIARAEYRRALIGGDLPAAVRARQKIIEAEISLDRCRFLVEGDL